MNSKLLNIIAAPIEKDDEMAAYATKYAVYFPKMYSWLTKTDAVELTRDINKAVMFDELHEVEGRLEELKLKEAVIQKYKATLVIVDNICWRAPC